MKNSVLSAPELKLFRLSHGLTQSQIAELLYVTIRSVENWEQGISPIPRAYLELLKIKLANGVENAAIAPLS